MFVFIYQKEEGRTHFNHLSLNKSCADDLKNGRQVAKLYAQIRQIENALLSEATEQCIKTYLIGVLLRQNICFLILQVFFQNLSCTTKQFTWTTALICGETSDRYLLYIHTHLFCTIDGEFAKSWCFESGREEKEPKFGPTITALCPLSPN